MLDSYYAESSHPGSSSSVRNRVVGSCSEARRRPSGSMRRTHSSDRSAEPAAPSHLCQEAHPTSAGLRGQAGNPPRAPTEDPNVLGRIRPADPTPVGPGPATVSPPSPHRDSPEPGLPAEGMLAVPGLRAGAEVAAPPPEPTTSLHDSWHAKPMAPPKGPTPLPGSEPQPASKTGAPRLRGQVLPHPLHLRWWWAHPG